MEILDMKRNRTPRAAKKQKLLNASSEVKVPKKKAMAFVKEVMVMEDPEWMRPTFILFSMLSMLSV